MLCCALAISRCAESQSAVRLCRRDGAAARSLRHRAAEHRHPAGVAAGDRRDCRGLAEFARRLGRSDPLQSHARQDAAAGAARWLRRQLHSLWCPRARHGGGDERHRAAWRLYSLWRHVSHLCRLQPARDQAGGADGGARHPCDDARLRSDWAKTVPPISRSSIWRRCGLFPICWCSGPATPSRPPRPGIARCGRRPIRRCCACRGRRCRRSVTSPATSIWSRSAPMWWSSRRMAATSL